MAQRPVVSRQQRDVRFVCVIVSAQKLVVSHYTLSDLSIYMYILYTLFKLFSVKSTSFPMSLKTHVCHDMSL